MHLMYFCFIYKYRISSRALLIPFKNPKVGPRNTDQAAAYKELPDSLEAVSSMAADIIQIEKEFINGGRTEILDLINPVLFQVVGFSNPRIVTGCSILMYFTYKVCIAKIYMYHNYTYCMYLWMLHEHHTRLLLCPNYMKSQYIV